MYRIRGTTSLSCKMFSLFLYLRSTAAAQCLFHLQINMHSHENMMTVTLADKTRPNHSPQLTDAMRAGARVALMWPTALSTPRAEKEGRWERRRGRRDKHHSVYSSIRCTCAHTQTNLCPCSGSCLHPSALEPHRCLWTLHWALQP